MWYLSRVELHDGAESEGPEVDRLAREVAARTGETLTTAVAVALKERLARLKGRRRRRPLREELREIRAALRRPADPRRPVGRRDRRLRRARPAR